MNINKDNIIELRNSILENLPKVICFDTEIIKAVEANKEINDYLESIIDNRNMKHVTKNEAVAIAKDFLKYLQADYVRKFDDMDKLMLTKEEVNYELANLKGIDNELRLLSLKEDGSTLMYLQKDDELKIILNILMCSNINDALKLVHEFMHLVSLNYNDLGSLEEVIPIYSELVMTDYLLDKGIDIKELMNYWLDRNRSLVPDNMNFYYYLKIISLFSDGKEITKENLGLDQGRFDYFINYISDKNNYERIIDEFEDVDVEHLIGYYMALEMYSKVNLNFARDVVNGLCNIKLNFGDKKYLECIRNIMFGNTESVIKLGNVKWGNFDLISDRLVRDNVKKLICTVIEELPDLFKYKSLYIDVYENMDDLYDNVDATYISKRQVINMAKMFLADVDFSYYQLFKKQKILMMTRKEINEKQDELFDFNTLNEAIRAKNNEFNDMLKVTEFMGSNIMPVNDIHKINILVENNVNDVFALVHEFVHIVSNSVNDRDGAVHNEIQSIFSELVLRDYLIDMGISSEEIDSVIDKKALWGCSDECYAILKMFDLLNRGCEISVDSLCCDEETFDSLMEDLKEDDVVDRYMEMLDVNEMACSHIIGYYYASKLYNAIPKRMRLFMLKNLNDVSKNVSDLEYMNYIRDIIDNNIKEKNGNIMVRRK